MNVAEATKWLELRSLFSQQKNQLALIALKLQTRHERQRKVDFIHSHPNYTEHVAHPRVFIATLGLKCRSAPTAIVQPRLNMHN